MVADNDLALGRIVERISKSNVWANSLILVTEDDAQDGVDHVDGHRTIGARHRTARAARRGGFQPLQPHQHDPHHPGDLPHSAAHPRPGIGARP